MQRLTEYLPWNDRPVNPNQTLSYYFILLECCDRNLSMKSGRKNKIKFLKKKIAILIYKNSSLRFVTIVHYTTSILVVVFNLGIENFRDGLVSIGNATSGKLNNGTKQINNTKIKEKATTGIVTVTR